MLLHKILNVLKVLLGHKALKLLQLLMLLLTLLMLLRDFLQLVWFNKVLILYGNCMQVTCICKAECQCMLPCATCLKS